MIQSVLISGELDDSRLARALGELADLSSVLVPHRRVVIVIDSDGGNIRALHAFLECIFADPQTRTLVESAKVKIYNAQSAAAAIALSFGCWREMAAGTCIGFHWPLLTLEIADVGADNRMRSRVLKDCTSTEELLDQLIMRYGLEEPALRSEFYNSGWLRPTAEVCLRRGLVDRLFPTDPSEVVSPRDQRGQQQQGSRTILLSGLLTEEPLNRVLHELRDIAADSSSDEDVVFLFDSPGGAMFPTVAFLDAVLGDNDLRRVVGRARVKIYQAHLVAALLAFSLGIRREIAAQTKVCFNTGRMTVQVGDPEHFESDGRVSSQIMDGWRKYQSMVYRLMRQLGLDDDPKLQAQLLGGGRVELTAEECLLRGIVDRLF
jgi:ATP-dependent protease ClpP protease subunit